MHALRITVWLSTNENRKNADSIIIHVNITSIFKTFIVFFIFDCCQIVNNFNFIALNFLKMLSFYRIFDEEKKLNIHVLCTYYTIILTSKVFCKECYFLKDLKF